MDATFESRFAPSTTTLPVPTVAPGCRLLMTQSKPGKRRPPQLGTQCNKQRPNQVEAFISGWECD
jgi:hypothetical protein